MCKALKSQSGFALRDDMHIIPASNKHSIIEWFLFSC